MAETVIPEGAGPQTPQTRRQRIEHGRSVLEAVNHEAGQQVLTFDQDNGGWNLNYTTFTGGSSSGSAVAKSASTTPPVRIPTPRPRL